MLMLKKGGKMVMVLLPKDGIHVVDMDKNLFDYLEVPQKEQLMSLPKATLIELLGQSGYVGNINRMTCSELSDLCMQMWLHIAKAYAVNSSSIAMKKEDNPSVKQLNVFSAFTPFECYITVEGSIKFHFYYDENTKFGSLFFFLNNEGIQVGDPTGECFFILKSGISAAYSHEIISSWGNTGMTFHLIPFHLGGVLYRGVRTSLKKDDIIAKVVSRSKETIIKKIDRSLVLTLDENPPAVFTNVLNGIEQKVMGYHQKMLSGELSMDMMMTSLTDEQVEYLVKVFSYKTSESTEQKVIEAVEIIYPDAVALEQVIPHIKKVKMSIISFFLEFFCRECHNEQGTDITYSNKKFLKMLLDVQSYRKGVKASVQSQAEDPAPEQSQGYCRQS